MTVLIRFWKENGSVWCAKSTRDAFVKPPFDTKLSLYPVAFMNWERIKNSYHGQAAITELLPNQIFINKCYAMGMDYVKKLAFPKLIYDKNRFPNGFSNKIGEAIKIEGNVNDAIATAFKMPDMSGAVMELVEKQCSTQKNTWARRTLRSATCAQTTRRRLSPCKGERRAARISTPDVLPVCGGLCADFC